MSTSITETPYVDVALEAARAAVAAAEGRDMRIAVVILDYTFTDVAVLRMDGAFASTVRVARAKAHTAVNFGTPTSAIAERVTPENKVALSTVEPRLMFVGGGVPLRSGDQLVGGLGVSGGSEADDVAVAEAAMTSIAHLLGT
jgi:uncharacterized protein GlcG (DUF336 family)